VAASSPSDRPEPTELFNLDADALPDGIWNDDWGFERPDQERLSFEGCENGHFYIVKLNRGYGADERFTVGPELVLEFRGWNQTLLANIGSKDVVSRTHLA